MAKHIHVHVHTSDNFSESDHPRAKNGQFGSGGGGQKPGPGGGGALPMRVGAGGGDVNSAQNIQARIDAKKATSHNATHQPAKLAKEPSEGEMRKHPNYNKEDHEYLKGKGWSNSQIHQRWTAEHTQGQGPAKGKPKAPDVVGVIANKNFYRK